MEQARGLIQRQRLTPQLLTDARDLTGERLRLWDVFGSVDHSRLTPSLAAEFEQVSWLPGPLPAAVWVVDFAHASQALPPEAQSWRSAPVGVVYSDARGVAPKGYALQAQMQQVFAGFQHVQYLGVLSSRRWFDLLQFRGDHLRKQVQVFRKWCLEWRRKHWLGHHSRASFTTDGGMGK